MASASRGLIPKNPASKRVASIDEPALGRVARARMLGRRMEERSDVPAAIVREARDGIGPPRRRGATAPPGWRRRPDSGSSCPRLRCPRRRTPGPSGASCSSTPSSSPLRYFAAASGVGYSKPSVTESSRPVAFSRPVRQLDGGERVEAKVYERLVGIDRVGRRQPQQVGDLHSDTLKHRRRVWATACLRGYPNQPPQRAHPARLSHLRRIDALALSGVG